MKCISCMFRAFYAFENNLLTFRHLLGGDSFGVVKNMK
jgi:hypothetical protein